MTKKASKIISNIAIIIDKIVAGVKHVSIVLSQKEKKTFLVIKIFNECKSFNRSLIDRLRKKKDDGIIIKDFCIYITHLLLEHFEVKMNCTYIGDLLEIELVLS